MFFQVFFAINKAIHLDAYRHQMYSFLFSVFCSRDFLLKDPVNSLLRDLKYKNNPQHDGYSDSQSLSSIVKTEFIVFQKRIINRSVDSDPRHFRKDPCNEKQGHRTLSYCASDPGSQSNKYGSRKISYNSSCIKSVDKDPADQPACPSDKSAEGIMLPGYREQYRKSYCSHCRSQEL